MATTAIVRKTGRTLRPTARRRRGAAQPAAERTALPDRYGFLNHTFTPVWLCEGDRLKLTQAFFASLKNLCAYYQFDLPDTGGLNFPQDIYQAWAVLQQKIRAVSKDKECLIIQDNDKAAVLATVEKLDLSNCLFYIPVRPYWRLANDERTKPLAELILCLFAYLHQQAGIPFYMQSGGFMDYQYDLLENWYYETQDDDEEEKSFRQLQQDTIYELRQAGAHIFRQVDNPQILESFTATVSMFAQQHRDEREWIVLSSEFLNLRTLFPDRQLSDYINTDLLYPDEEERITANQYTGFFWSAYDCLFDDLDSMINESFQEIPVMDEPVHIRFFDQMPKADHNPLDYEKKLFALMEQLRDLLNRYDHEEHYATI